MAQIKEGLAKSGSCYTADFQTNGKGQHGRVWESTQGQNLLCTYILELKQLDSTKTGRQPIKLAFQQPLHLAFEPFLMDLAKGRPKSSDQMISIGVTERQGVS